MVTRDLIMINMVFGFLILLSILNGGKLALNYIVLAICLDVIFSLCIIYLDTPEKFSKKRENHPQEVYETEALPNTLLVDDSQNFVAYSGWLFKTTTTENNYLGIIRLQDQFKVLNFETQKGSVYLIDFSREIGRKWSTLPLNKQRDCLQDIFNHLENFKSSLYELIPGVQTRQLTYEELEEELDFEAITRTKIDFIPEKPRPQEDLKDLEAADQNLEDLEDFEADVQLENELVSKTVHSIEEQ